jgi:hypothetical protein
MPDRDSIDALKCMLSEVETLISTTTPMPENRTPRCLELLRAATAIADDLARSGGGKRPVAQS